MVFSNEHKSYSKMRVKQPLDFSFLHGNDKEPDEDEYPQFSCYSVLMKGG